MQRVLYKGQEFVLSRLSKGIAELVHAKECNIQFAPISECIGVHTRERPLVPGAVPFLERPSDFVTKLQEERLQHLLEHRKKKLTKSRTKSSDPDAQPRTKKTKTGDMIAELIKLSLTKGAPK